MVLICARKERAQHPVLTHVVVVHVLPKCLVSGDLHDQAGGVPRGLRARNRRVAKVVQPGILYPGAIARVLPNSLERIKTFLLIALLRLYHIPTGGNTPENTGGRAFLLHLY